MARTTRRSFLGGVATAATLVSRAGQLAAARPTPATPFRYSICNEVFEKMEFAASCRMARKLGYTGLEIAPFTLAENVDDVSAERRRELGRMMKSEGITFAGLHWLLVTPKWLHITTGDKDVRERSWDYFRKLVDLCGDLGGGVMVLGSPKQRGTRGATRDEATKYLRDGLAKLAAHAAARKAIIAMEALDHTQTDVVNTLDEAAAIVKQVKKPAIQTMFDVHNTLDEKEPHDALVRQHYGMIRHVHINEMDGRHPGTGTYDFLPVMRALRDKGYRGWLSLEVFDFKPGAERIGREAMEHLKKVEARLA